MALWVKIVDGKVAPLESLLFSKKPNIVETLTKPNHLQVVRSLVNLQSLTGDLQQVKLLFLTYIKLKFDFFQVCVA